jgi:hypothetical protein
MKAVDRMRPKLRIWESAWRGLPRAENMLGNYVGAEMKMRCLRSG